jgi:hypothetical protein
MLNWSCWYQILESAKDFEGFAKLGCQESCIYTKSKCLKLCYEVLINRVPLKNVYGNYYNVVIRGQRLDSFTVY